MQATLINPVDSEAFFHLSQVCLELDDRESAVEALRRAVDLEPGDERYARALASASEPG